VTRVVQLSDAAYEHLRQLKRRGESFSDVVLRLTARASWETLRGLRSPERIAQARAALAAVDALDDAEVRAWRSSTRRS
jgi:predicted CopG family antitoxin